MFCGLIAFDLSSTQELHYRATRANKSLTGKTWSKKFIRYLLQVTKSLWKKRCEIMNVCAEKNVDHKIRSDCKSLYYQLKLSKLLPYNFSYLLEKTPAFFTTAKPQALNSWMRKIKLGMAQIDKGSVNVKSDIRSWLRKSPASAPVLSSISLTPQQLISTNSKDSENWYKKPPREKCNLRRSLGIGCSTTANLPPILPQCLLSIPEDDVLQLYSVRLSIFFLFYSLLLTSLN